PLALMIKQGFLSKPHLVDATIAHYDFSALSSNSAGNYNEGEVNSLLTKYPRVTQAIIEQVVSLAEQRVGVMIFAATTNHAREIIGYLADESCAMILGDTPYEQRDQIINDFKDKKIKYLVNVAVLTTGFDAPHVDFIALLRPTQSLGLFQQIVGRGLRLSPDKEDCLIIDYAGSGFDIYSPEVGSAKPNSDSVPVLVTCPQCQFGNTFWGKTDEDGTLIEHYGRRCWGTQAHPQEQQGQQTRCDYRFRFKECSQCGSENDIAARRCLKCDHAIIDPDQLLKNALKLKDALVLRCSGMTLSLHDSKDKQFKITYFDEDGASISESFNFNYPAAIAQFNQEFGRRLGQGSAPTEFKDVQQVMQWQHQLVAPDFVVGRKQKYYWQIKEKIFDYQGNFRKANQLF
ncbi:MAG: ATP-dependent helicase, partial [Psychrobium sp.]|nr:ATP-dependent helicase [Psychrobium sp.]